MWKYNDNFNPEDYFGFIYKINNLINGMFYIGKKQFTFTRKVKVKSRKNKKIKIKPSNWENYWGSSEPLLNDVKIYGEENFERVIIKLCKNKAEQTYYENYYIYENHNLLNPLCYNKHIGHVYAKNINNLEIKVISTLIPKEPKEIDDKSIISDYNKGINIKELCKKYKICLETLLMILPEEIRGSNKLWGKRWDKNILNKIKILYKENLSHQKIGEQVGLDHGTVKYILNNKLKINTTERDLRTKRPRGLTTKPILYVETNQTFKGGVNEAYDKLKIPKYIIRNSLKINSTFKGYTFKYLLRENFDTSKL